MAKSSKGLLGSGSKGRTSAGKGKLPALGIPNMPADQPWVNPATYETQERAGVAGKMLHETLLKSKSTGIKVPK